MKAHIRNKHKAAGGVKKRRLRLFILIPLLAIVLFFLIGALISLTWNNTITEAYYTVASPKLTRDMRIVLISDLHRKKFDDTNQTLVDLIAAKEPDLICVDGDMLERGHTESEDEEFVSLLARLAEIAPTYFAPGNHDYMAYCASAQKQETEYDGMLGRSELLDRLEATGAVFVEENYRDVVINVNDIRIGGFYEFAYLSEYDTDESWARRRPFLEDFCGTDSFKLMLSHRPDSFIYSGAGSAWDIDLVLSGHTHNGVIALPFIHRAIWTSEGLFPEHDRGLFDLGSMKMVITSGFDGHPPIPRVFNPPEIAVIDLLAASD